MEDFKLKIYEEEQGRSFNAIRPVSKINRKQS